MGIFCCFPDPVDFDAEVRLKPSPRPELHRGLQQHAPRSISDILTTMQMLSIDCIIHLQLRMKARNKAGMRGNRKVALYGTD